MNLIGLWSAYIFFYDTFEDYCVCFDKDGTGFFIYSRPYNDEIDFFKWSVSNDEISFLGYKKIIVENEIVIESSSSELDRKTRIKFGKEKLFTGVVVDVIEFLEKSDFYETKFGIVERDLLENPNYRRIVGYYRTKE